MNRHVAVKVKGVFMSDLNSVQLFARVVRDGEIRTTAEGTKILSFSIAVNRSKKDGNGNYVDTGNFFPLALFGDYAVKMQPYLKKGQKIIIEGFLFQNRWTNKDGKTRSTTEIGVSKLHLIFDSKKSEEGTHHEEPEAANPQDFEPTEQQMQEIYSQETEEDLAPFENEDDIF